MNPDGDKNQNTSNGVPNADPTQQAIFTPTPTSAPEPQRPAQDSSVIVGSVVEPAATGLSHQYYSNHPTRTSASGVGDIVVGGTPKKKLSKKTILLVISAVAFLVIIAATFIIIFSSSKNTAKNGLSDVEVAFNRYANYLLFGQKRDALDGKFDPYQTYEVDRQLALDPLDMNYWNEASKLLNDATASLSSSDGAYKDELMVALNNYQENFSFIQTYAQITNEPSEEDMLQAYLKSGPSGVNEYLNNFYSKINDLESSLAEDFITLKRQQYSLATGKFDFYSEVGCIRNGSMIVQNCNQANITDSIETRFLELVNASNSAMDKSNALVRNSILYLKSYCWSFSHWLNDPAQYSENEGED